MRLFGGESEEEKAIRERREASVASMEQGGLPLNAIDRLREQAARQGTPQHLFSSAMTVNEFALTRDCGYEAVGQVMGSSVYHIGWQSMPGNSLWNWDSGELTVLTQAYYDARHLAINRLRQEAKLLKADGVVGVRLDVASYTWGAGMLEFAAIGTAVRRTGAPPLAEPFVSDLSGQDHWALRQAGYKPVGFAMGNCTWYQVASWNTRNLTSGGIFGGAWTNAELPDFTQAVYTARELAMARMTAEAHAVGAEGIVGVRVEPHIEPREVGSESNRRVDLVIHFTSFGTSIARDEDSTPLGDLMVLPMRKVGGE